MANTSEYENMKEIVLDGKNVNADNLAAFHKILSSVRPVDDISCLLPVVFNYSFSDDMSIQKAAIPVLKTLADFLEVNAEVKNDEWWPKMKTNINDNISKISPMISEGREEWCSLWCSIVTILGKDLRVSIKTINALLKVAEKAFKTSSERDRGFECWCKLIDNFALCPDDMNSKRRLNLLLIPLQAHNHSNKESCTSKLNTWKHLLSNLEATNEKTLHTVVPPFLQFLYEGIGSMPPACNYLPDQCAQIFKLLLSTESVFQILSKQFIKSCSSCILSLRSIDPDLCVHIWMLMLSGVKDMSWPEDNVADIIFQLKVLFDEIGTTPLFTDILEATYNNGIPTSLLYKHYNSFVSFIISPYVVRNIKENTLKSFMDFMDRMNTFLLSETTFQLIMDRMNALFESEVKEESRSDLESNLRIIWLSLCDALCKWITNGGNTNEEKIKEDMKLVHNVLIFGITRLNSQWNKSILRGWKLLFSESFKYFLLLPLVNSEQFVSDLIERLIKIIKEQVSLSVAIEVSSILLEFSQSREYDSLICLLMEIGEKTLNLMPADMPKAMSLLNQFLKMLVIAVRTRPMLSAVCISVTENLSQVKIDLLATENQKISAKIMKTQMQLVSLKTVKTVDKSEIPTPSSSPTMTSFLHRLAKAEGNKTRSKVCSPQISQEQKTISQSSPKSGSQMFMDSSSQDDYVFVPPKKTVIPLTEHQKERMAARRSDIPALYQDLSQDSQSVNMESISLSRMDCKSPVKIRSPSKSPIKHFSEIGLNQTDFKKDVPRPEPEKGVLKSSNKQNNSPKKINKFLNSPSKSVHVCNNGVNSLSQNVTFEDVCNKILDSPLKHEDVTNRYDDSPLNITSTKDSFVDTPLEPKDSKSRSVMPLSNVLDTSPLNTTSTKDSFVDALLEHKDSRNRSVKSLSICLDDRGIKVFNSANHQSEKSPKQKCKSPIQSPLKIGLVDENLENKITITNKTASDTNETNSLELRKDNIQLKCGLENCSKSPGKTKSVTPVKINVSNLNNTESLHTEAISELCKSNKTLNIVNDDSKRMTSKTNSPKDKSVSNLTTNENINNGALLKDDIRKVLFNEGDNKDVEQKSELSIKTVDNANNEVSPPGIKTRKGRGKMTASIKKNIKSNQKIRNKIHKSDEKHLVEVVFEDNKLTTANLSNEAKEKNGNNQVISGSVECENKNIINTDEITNFESSMNDTIDKQVISELQSKDSELDSIKVADPLKVKCKRSKRQSLPAKLSPVKTRRTARQLYTPDHLFPKKRKSLGNINKSVEQNVKHVKKSSSRFDGESPKVQNHESNHLDLNEIDKEKKREIKKRKLNQSIEHNTLVKKAKPVATAENKPEESFEDSKSTKSTTEISCKNGVDCNSNMDISTVNQLNSCPIELLNNSLNKNISNLQVGGKTCDTQMLNGNIVDEVITKNAVLESELIDVIEKIDSNNQEGFLIKSSEGHSSSSLPTNIKEERSELEESSCEIDNSSLDNTESITNNSDEVGSTDSKCLTLKKLTTCDKQSKYISSISLEASDTPVGKNTSFKEITSNEVIELSSKLEKEDFVKNNKDVSITQEKNPSKIVELESSFKECAVKNHLVLSNSSEMPSICVRNLSNVCLTPVKQNCENQFRTKILFSLDSPNKINDSKSNSEQVVISLLNEDIAILDNKCKTKSNNKNADKIMNNMQDEELLLHSNKVITLESGLNKETEITPQKVSPKQIEFLKHSPILVKAISKVDCTPSKVDTMKKCNSPKSNSPNNYSQNISGSNKIVNKKLTSPNLNDWVLRTPIKKSQEDDIICKNNGEENFPDSTVVDVQHESEDIIPSSQEPIDKSKNFFKISFGNISETLNLDKPNSISQFKSISTCVQNEESRNTKSLISPKKITPVKKSVCRRLVVDGDKSSEIGHELDKQIHLASSLGESEKPDTPILTSDKEYDECKELIVQCSEELNCDTENVVAVANEIPKVLLENPVIPDQSENCEEVKPFSLRKSLNKVVQQSPKKSLEPEVIALSSPKSPKRRTSQLMALVFKKDDTGDGVETRKGKRNQLFRSNDSGAVENQQPEHNHLMETWVCRIYSPNASPNTSILKRKVSPDDSPEPSSPVNKDKRKRVSFLDPVVSESLVFSKSEFGKGQIVRAEPKLVEPRYEPDTQSQGSVPDEEFGNSQVSIFPALENCTHPISNILERDVTKEWMIEMEARLERLGVTTVGDLCKLSEATIQRLPFPPPKVKRLCLLLQEYLEEISHSPPKKLKISPTKEQELGSQHNSTNDTSSEESITDIASKVSSYFQTYPELVETLGKTLEIDTIMSMLNVAVGLLKSKQTV